MRRSGIGRDGIFCDWFNIKNKAQHGRFVENIMMLHSFYRTYIHREMEPTITRIIRLVSDREDESSEPIKLLEVNTATSQSGILPVFFGPDSERGISHPHVVVEITEDEFQEIKCGKLTLPHGWQQGQIIYSSKENC